MIRNLLPVRKETPPKKGETLQEAYDKVEEPVAIQKESPIRDKSKDSESSRPVEQGETLLAHVLDDAFCWADTKEGHDYWCEVYDNLIKGGWTATDPDEPLSYNFRAGFNWATTPQGLSYWGVVTAKLRRIEEEGR